MSMCQNFSQMNNPYMPVQNPYMDRINFLQNYQQNLQQPMIQAQMPGTNQQMSIAGKVVDSIDVVKATDIPMDGNAYYFPKADGTEVYCKQWLQNGTTRILTFKPVLDSEANNSSNDDRKDDMRAFGEVLEEIQNDIRLLNEKIDKMPKPVRAKKEVSENE